MQAASLHLPMKLNRVATHNLNSGAIFEAARETPMITRFAPSSLILLSCDIHATRTCTLRYNRLFESGDALPNKNYAHKKINPEIKTRRTSYGKHIYYDYHV